MDEDQESDDLESRQRLKAALHYTVGTICKEAVEDATFSRDVVAIMTETAFKQSELFATDLELFAKHAKRTTVSVEDVRLCSRRNPSLSEFITKQSEQLRAEREERAERGGTGGGAGGGATTTDGQELPKQPLKLKGKRKEKKS